MEPFTILVPLDGSSFSRQMLLQVCRIFNPATYGLVLLRIADVPDGLTGSPPYPIALGHGTISMYRSTEDMTFTRHPIYSDQMSDSFRAEFEAALQVDAANLAEIGYTVSTIVRFGNPAEEIINVAQEQPVDMIAMATHGRTGLQRLVMGSVAERVLHQSPIPVLLVRPQGNEADLHVLQRSRALEYAQ